MTDLPINRIILRADARAIDPATIEGLAESIANVGLINPLRVRQSGEGWEVIAGAHRLAACKSLGLVEVACEVVTDDDLHAELAMIDENLCRAELTPVDRARQTARRKAIYEELHRETKHGGNTGGPSGQFVHTDTESFTENTAKAIGKDQRTVRRDAERGGKVIEEVLDMIQGTKLDTGSYLDKLRKLPPNEQVHAAKRDLAFTRQQERDEAARVRLKKANQDVRGRAAKAVAGWLADHASPDDLDFLISNLDAAGASAIAQELTTVTQRADA